MALELTDEQARMLRAIRDGRFRVNEHGRYVIDDESRRRERERAFKRGLFHGNGSPRVPYALTEKGAAALAAYEAHNGGLEAPDA